MTSENPLKVIVAGGGVGGLFLAKALQKQGAKVTVLEKTSKFARFGGPIQVFDAYPRNLFSCSPGAGETSKLCL